MRTLTLLSALILATACNGGANADGRYHPRGFSDPSVHGAELRMGVQSCTACHGADLTGSGTSTVSCDTCHADGWRSNCTYCHGGDETDLGAPPRGLDDTADPATLAFKAHSAHGRGDKHMVFDCAECHVQPTDVLSEGHVFDDTPGKAEVDFGAGLSNVAAWDGNGGCSNLYCHGNGRTDTGTANASTANLACNSCHAGRSVGTAWLQMSGKHAKHLWEGIGCEVCHADTVNASDTLVDPARHVNGIADVRFNTNVITIDAGHCTGACHGEGHNNTRW